MDSASWLKRDYSLYNQYTTNITHQKSDRCSVSKSYFTNIALQNANKAFVYITDCNPCNVNLIELPWGRIFSIVDPHSINDKFEVI